MAREGGSECTVGTRVGATVGEGGGRESSGGARGGQGRAARHHADAHDDSDERLQLRAEREGEEEEEEGERAAAEEVDEERDTRAEQPLERGAELRGQRTLSAAHTRSAPRTRAQRRAHALSAAHTRSAPRTRGRASARWHNTFAHHVQRPALLLAGARVRSETHRRDEGLGESAGRGRPADRHLQQEARHPRALEGQADLGRPLRRRTPRGGAGLGWAGLGGTLAASPRGMFVL